MIFGYMPRVIIVLDNVYWYTWRMWRAEQTKDNGSCWQVTELHVSNMAYVERGHKYFGDISKCKLKG